jgi:hypothetical protein
MAKSKKVVSKKAVAQAETPVVVAPMPVAADSATAAEVPARLRCLLLASLCRLARRKAQRARIFDLRSSYWRFHWP